MYRCINDVFGYCDEAPDGHVYNEQDIVNLKAKGLSDGFAVFEPVSCKKDLKTCGCFKTHTEVSGQ